MSTHHGEAVAIKPISKVAKFQKNLIPANIPDSYTLNPILKSIASEENIRSGVIAFRNFLYLFFDRLISDGHLYTKPSKKPIDMTNYPPLSNISNLLVDIGYNSMLAESGGSLLITEIPSCTAPKPLISVSNQIVCLRFLVHCGFVFTGIDLESKKFNISESQIEVSYPDNPILLTGLKAMSVAEIELRTTRRYKNDESFLWCDYRLLKAEDTDILDVPKDYLHPLPEDVQDFAIKLHQHNINMGMTCVLTILSDIHFAYSYVKNSQRALSPRNIYQQRVWGFSISMKSGYCLVVRAKKTDKYTDVIKNFSLPLQKAIANGYGCYRKIGLERCQEDCQGIRIPLDESILDMSEDIETWLDNEMPGSLRK